MNNSNDRFYRCTHTKSVRYDKIAVKHSFFKGLSIYHNYGIIIILFNDNFFINNINIINLSQYI